MYSIIITVRPELDAAAPRQAGLSCTTDYCPGCLHSGMCDDTCGFCPHGAPPPSPTPRRSRVRMEQLTSTAREPRADEALPAAGGHRRTQVSLQPGACPLESFGARIEEVNTACCDEANICRSAAPSARPAGPARPEV